MVQVKCKILQKGTLPSLALLPLKEEAHMEIFVPMMEEWVLMFQNKYVWDQNIIVRLDLVKYGDSHDPSSTSTLMMNDLPWICMRIYQIIYTQKYIHIALFIFRDMYAHIQWMDKTSFVESKFVSILLLKLECDGCEALNRLLL